MKLALAKTAYSLKWQLTIVVGVVLFLTFMPLMAIFALAGHGKIVSNGNFYTGPGLVTDTYVYGNCTYWVALLRAQINQPIPYSWGNAATWASRAHDMGYRVDHTPRLGAIMQSTAGALGHVAFVESVNPANGSWTISEMNVVGWDIVDEQTMSATAALNYSFIHQGAP